MPVQPGRLGARVGRAHGPGERFARPARGFRARRSPRSGSEANEARSGRRWARARGDRAAPRARAAARACVARGRAGRRRRDHAGVRLLRELVARRRHLEHHPRGDGEQAADRRDARRRQQRARRIGHDGDARAAGGQPGARAGAAALLLRPGRRAAPCEDCASRRRNPLRPRAHGLRVLQPLRKRACKGGHRRPRDRPSSNELLTMCGITGIVDLVGRREISRALLARMNEAQHHRGPDAGGVHVEPGVGLGHRRLSIIDLATGQQPLYNEDRSVVVVYNGEIYNYQSLIPELARRGHVFRTKSDTEVIVHAWEEWGEACVERFRGMFAFALWDRNRQTLFLARDRLGVKPLHYALLPGGELNFGSELKSLAAHPGLARELDPLAIEDYFAFGYIPEPRTIYKMARKLAPGHTLSARRGQPLPEPRPYWDVRFTLDNPAGERDAQAELVERLKEAVRLRLISEVPLGAFLSGGVDSSAVVAMMAGVSADPVNTCSIAFTDPAFDETAYARQVAERYRTRHFVDTVDSDDFSLIDVLARTYDERPEERR